MDFNSRIAQFRAEVNDLNTSAALDWRLFLGGYNLRRVAATGWSESERGTIACTVARRRKGSPDWMRYMVYGVWLFRVCDGEFSFLHDQGSQRR